jgi:hypothetical protein
MSDQQYLFFLYRLCQENSQHRFSLYKEPHMAGETALATLLRSMSPQLNDGDYVFCSVPDHRIPPGCEVIGSFHEQASKRNRPAWCLTTSPRGSP